MHTQNKTASAAWKEILEAKLQAKLTLQETANWPKEPRIPLLCIPFGMTEALGGAVMKEALPGILSQQVELLVLGKGTPEYGTLFTQLAKEEPHRVRIVANQPEEVKKMLAAADMALFFSEPSKEDIALCLSAGIVPISPASPLLEDYSPAQESGNAFTTDGHTAWHWFSALVRALETYKLPYDWRTIQRHCLEGVEK